MESSTKRLLSIVVLSGVIAAGCCWWWERLMVDTFAECVGAGSAVVIGCRHDAPMYGVIAFAELAATLTLAALFRAALARSGGRRTA